MSNWLPVDPESANPTQTKREGGVTIELFMAPHDVPEAVRGQYDQQKRRFVIEFRYIDDEPGLREGPKAEHLQIFFGRHSGRIRRIEVDVDTLKARQVTLRTLVSDRVNAMLRRMGEGRRLYDVSRRVIEQKQPELFEDLAAVV